MTAEYATTPLTDILPTKKHALKRLAAGGFRTLESCASGGTQALLKIKDVGVGTIRTLRKECNKRRIQWIKSREEWVHHEQLKHQLMEEYELSGSDADKVCEIRFIEMWT